MHIRLTTITDAKDLDAGIAFIRETVSPVLHQQKGFAGLTASIDRENRLLSALSQWETEADRDASESAILKVRDEAVRITGGHVEVELFEQTLFEVVAGPPREGASLLVTRVSMDPATVDQTQAYFQKEVLPQIRTSPGVVAIRNLINRETGDAMTGVVYTDRKAMEAGVKMAEERQRANPDVPVRIQSRSLREVALIDMP
jgi:hypothetical protein